MGACNMKTYLSKLKLEPWHQCLLLLPTHLSSLPFSSAEALVSRFH